MFHTNIFFIYLLSFATAVVTQFFIPAETPMIPMLVKKELLLSANALFGMGIYGSILVAYALSGTLLLLSGKFITFIILAAFFLLAGIFASLIKSKRIKDGTNDTVLEARIPIGNEIKNALSLILKTKEVYHSLFLLTLSQILILIMAVVGPGYAIEVLGIEVDQFPLVFVTPAALGMVIAALVLANFFPHSPKKLMATIGVFVSSFAMLLLPFGSKAASADFIQGINTMLPNAYSIDILHVMILLAFVLGVATALVFVPSNTILQEETSDRVRGKVYGALNAFTGVFSLFPIVIVGGLADVFGVSSVVSGIGIGLLLLGIFRLMLR